MGRKATDLTGVRVGNLVVVERAYGEQIKKGRPFWLCLCDCGNTTVVSASHLKKGEILSCGCRQKRNDLSGRRFGRWTVIDRREIKSSQQMWLCRCDCGSMRKITHSSLGSGKSRSCGCLHKEEMAQRLTTHGMSNRRLYNIYHNMKSRCFNHNNDRYKDYGARGISVCKEWENDFKEFANWALKNGYSENMTIERVDNDGDYCPENCRWVSLSEQTNNKRTSIRIELFGETKTLKQWCEFMGWNYKKYYARYHRGYETFRGEDVDEIFSKLRSD